jgi:hypothetical protein
VQDILWLILRSYFPDVIDEDALGLHTLMPWLAFSGLTPDDLRAIHAFLRTVKPVHHAVETHPGAKAA